MSLRSAPESVVTVWVYFASSAGISLRMVPMPMDLTSISGSSVVPSSMSPSAWAAMPYSSDQRGTSRYFSASEPQVHALGLVSSQTRWQYRHCHCPRSRPRAWTQPCHLRPISEPSSQMVSRRKEAGSSLVALAPLIR